MKKYKLLIALVSVLVIAGVSLAFATNGNLQGMIFNVKNQAVQQKTRTVQPRINYDERVVKINDKLLIQSYTLEVGEIGINHIAFSLYQEKNGRKIPHPSSPVKLGINDSAIKPYMKAGGLIKGLYVSLDKIDLENGTATIRIFKSCKDLVDVCKSNKSNEYCSDYCVYEKLDNEIQLSNGNYVGFSDKNYENFLDYMLNSLSLCEYKITEYTGLSNPSKPIYFKIFTKNALTSGLGAKYDSITMYSSVSDMMDNQSRIEQLVDGWGNLQNELVNNICPLEFAQGHELVHIFLAGTPIGIGYCAGSSGVCGSFNEGLAEYLKYKINNDETVICEDNGFKYSYAPDKLYNYYNFSSENNSGVDAAGLYDTGLCMWDYIEKTYGHEAFKSILSKLSKYRNLPGVKKFYEHPIYGTNPYSYNILEDFIVPFTSDDIYQIFEDRFGVTKLNTHVSIPRTIDYY